MKITKTRLTELKAIELYEVSKQQDEEGARARERIEEILFSFRLIGAFADDDHARIVRELYFCEENILIRGVRKKAQDVFIHERRLQSYRNKYAAVLDILLE